MIQAKLWFLSLSIFLLYNLSCSKTKPEKKEVPKPIGKTKKALSKKEQIAILSAEIKSLNKQKRYKKASKAYAKLVYLQPSASAYYEYGNTLSNAKMYEKARAAFLKSIDSEPDHQKRRHAYYNVACMASLLHNEKEALEYIRNAIWADYNNLSHIKRDPDLQWLRQQPSFIDWLRSAESPAGKMVSSMGGMPYHRYFCGSPGNTFGQYASTPDSLYAYNAIFSTGTWRIEKNTIVIHITKEQGLKGIGKNKSIGGRLTEYEEYEKFERQVDEEYKLNLLSPIFYQSAMYTTGKTPTPCPPTYEQVKVSVEWDNPYLQKEKGKE